MSEKKLFQDWWKSESMENRVSADYEAWIEAGNECMDYMDIIQFQKDIAEVAWQAACRWKYTQDELPETETLIIGKSFDDFYFVYFTDGHFEDDFGNIHEIEKWQYVPEDV